MFSRQNKKASSEGISEIIKWILYIGIAIAAGFVIKRAITLNA